MRIGGKEMSKRRKQKKDCEGLQEVIPSTPTLSLSLNVVGTHITSLRQDTDGAPSSIGLLCVKLRDCCERIVVLEPALRQLLYSQHIAVTTVQEKKEGGSSEWVTATTSPLVEGGEEGRRARGEEKGG